MRLLVPALLLCVPAAASAAEEHRIEVELSPETSELRATDRVVTDAHGAFQFSLHPGLTIRSATLNGKEVAVEDVAGPGRGRLYRVPLAAEGTSTLEFRYSGKIADAVKKSADLSFVVGDDTTGVICPEGVYLAKESLWYPVTESMARFDVKATVPEPYLVVTQGTHAKGAEFWTGKYAADGVSLVAGKWKHAERTTAAGVVVGTYLSEANAASAKLLLDATEGYLKTYSELLGPYAYDRFDVVENFFTTGYGMPEFTLLGRDVVARMAAESQRTGSIPSGYLDHEIVHSWWGNLVFPDFEKGNWCEGLTSYCANYFSKEATSPEEAREYRRRAVLRFSIRANPARDYPVRRFVGKVEDIDDDIGYGKCSMIFHALRRDLGDQAFWDTLRRVSREARGQRFTWEDWQREFETTSRRKLGAFFRQALDRTGAPRFVLGETTVTADGGRLGVAGTVTQVLAPGEDPWRVTVPVVIEHLEGREEVLVDVSGEATRFSAVVPSLPLRAVIDPDFHVFRRLAPDEVPPCLAALLERPKKLVVWPDGDTALENVAKMAAARSGGTAVPASQAPLECAKGTSYLVFGDAARVPLLASLATKLPRHFPTSRSTPTTTILANSRSPADPDEFVATFVGAAPILAQRARAVFYYQYDGRIVFDGSVPKDRAQGLASNHGSRTLLPDLKGASSPETCREIVDHLAAPAMNGRLAGSREDKETRAFVREQLTLAGIDVDEQPFRFTVKSLDPAHPGLRVRVAGETWEPVAGAVPLVASPASAHTRAEVTIATDPEGDLAGRALLVDLPAGSEDLMVFVRTTAEFVRKRGAVALLLRLPAEPSPSMNELVEFPHAPNVTPLRAAGTARRTGADAEFAIPCIAVPQTFDVAKGPYALDVGFAVQEIATANMIGRLKGEGRRRSGVVVLSAHHDHLGAGFPGADDDASGLAALVEAARILSANANLLARDVVFVAFGAEEWGLRGSRAFLAAWPKGEPIVADVNADTVGRKGSYEVSVVGISKYPRFARTVAAALEQSALVVGADIDRVAFAWGSDHFSFHEAGIPAVDLWAGDYRVMHTAGDTPDGVDEKKISRIGRAMALAALAIAGGF